MLNMGEFYMNSILIIRIFCDILFSFFIYYCCSRRFEDSSEENDANNDENIEEVITTGSRIARDPAYLISTFNNYFR